jgi:PelA/Pel-15E family pectate lyase
MRIRPALRRMLAVSVAVSSLAAAACAQTPTAPPAAAEAPADVASRAQALATMKTATRFMVDRVAYKGGYVWSYLPDFSRRFGEMEAYPTMIWIQPPGTATMGHVFLDAYHATGDDYYYQAARKAADALIGAQHPAGGWNYLHDFAGEASMKKWYDTIGKNGWRLEEFQHYYGNATFDDAGTSESSQFLLRMYLEKKDPALKPPLEKAIRFVLDSQYPNGGWPQRFPKAKEAFSKAGRPDYTGYITFNDDVAGENIEFLLMVYQTLGDERVVPAIRRAMDSFLITQQPAPQAGWGLQHRVDDLKPAGARSYEPEALATHTTANNVQQLMLFYRLTGDRKYLARIPEALDWLDSVRLPDNLVNRGRAYPTFVQIGTNRPLFVHRRGSNVVNGEYYVDENPQKTLAHYSSFRAVDVPKLRAQYQELLATPAEEVTKGSPLLHRGAPLPTYFTTKDVSVSDLNVGVLQPAHGAPEASRVAELVKGLNEQGYWPTPLVSTSNPYIGDGSPTPAPGDFSETEVGDATDTSPYKTDKPVIGISTGRYIQNMSVLLQYVAPQK